VVIVSPNGQFSSNAGERDSMALTAFMPALLL
jgi:hypothetical protein